jgi:hypothetical protein
MTVARARIIGDAVVFAAMFGLAPLALAGAQAATVTMPKQSAQRAAAAANARLQAQVSQVEARQPTSRPPASRAPAAAASQSGQGQGAARQAPNVVQSGAPDPRARAAGAAATPHAGATARDPANAIMREVFDYGIHGRRDPFFSLLATGELRPMLSDLRLTTILYDPSGRRPVAVMNDVSTNAQYRVTTGMMLGRMRVTQIRPRKVIFAIDEFGFSRADSLVLADKPQSRQ